MKDTEKLIMIELGENPGVKNEHMTRVLRTMKLILN
jgi:CTP:molybdopterin cytidylyltransferase MocA